MVALVLIWCWAFWAQAALYGKRASLSIIARQ